MTTISYLPVSSIYIGLLALIIVVLGYRVTIFRRGEQIALGDNNSSKAMRCAIRAHGNAVENIPIACLLLIALELNSLNPVLLHFFGCVLFVSRVAHAWGLSKKQGVTPGRFYGTLFTWLSIIAMAILTIILTFIREV